MAPCPVGKVFCPKSRNREANELQPSLPTNGFWFWLFDGHVRGAPAVLAGPRERTGQQRGAHVPPRRPGWRIDDCYTRATPTKRAQCTQGSIGRCIGTDPRSDARRAVRVPPPISGERVGEGREWGSAGQDGRGPLCKRTDPATQRLSQTDVRANKRSSVALRRRPKATLVPPISPLPVLTRA